MKRLAEWLCLIELVLLVLVPFSVWMASVLNFNVVNILSEESVRWFFVHAALSLVSVHLALLILILSAIGSVQDSGLASALKEYFLGGSKAMSRSERSALIISLSFALVLFLALLLPALCRNEALLSITGGLLYSPWMCGFPLATSVIIIFTGILFAFQNGKLCGWHGMLQMLSVGISRYSLWIVDAMMAGLLYSIVQYTLFR